MQTDDTPISTYIFINKMTNGVEGESELTKYEVSQLNYALGLNGSDFKYINKTEIPTILTYKSLLEEISNYE